MRVLLVANKTLPESDHRLLYPSYSKVCSNMIYALPEKPVSLPEAGFVRVGIGEGVRPSYFMHFFLLFTYLLRHRRKLDCVHFYATTLILFGPLLARLAGVPSLITVTGFGRVMVTKNLRYRMLSVVYMCVLSISLRCTQWALFQNHGDMQWLGERLPRFSHKFRYIGSAVSMPVTHHKNFLTRKLRVLLVARLMPQKGIPDFLRVAELLPKETFEFVLAGPKSQGFDSLYDQVRDFHAKGIITYLGELPTSAVHAQFEQAHIFYFPSSYGEGMPRVMIECGFAQACPVAYDIPANLDLVAKGRGYLVGEGDTSKVVHTLEHLARDREELRQNAVAFQAHILDHFTMKSYAERMDAILLDMSK